jgi:hypothetical protein
MSGDHFVLLVLLKLKMYIMDVHSIVGACNLLITQIECPDGGQCKTRTSGVTNPGFVA